VLLSDGGDNASRTTKEEAVHKAQASNAVIYTIGLIEPDSRDANPGLLKELSLASGGELYRPKDSDGIADVLDKIARDIRHTYTIGFTPTNTARDGAFRTLRVVVTAPARTPAGWYAVRTGYPRRNIHTVIAMMKRALGLVLILVGAIALSSVGFHFMNAACSIVRREKCWGHAAPAPIPRHGRHRTRWVSASRSARLRDHARGPDGRRRRRRFR
jgi:hypothetical protein